MGAAFSAGGLRSVYAGYLSFMLGNIPYDVAELCTYRYVCLRPDCLAMSGDPLRGDVRDSRTMPSPNPSNMPTLLTPKPDITNSCHADPPAGSNCSRCLIWPTDIHPVFTAAA